jgi:hypothetical protein
MTVCALLLALIGVTEHAVIREAINDNATIAVAAGPLRRLQKAIRMDDAVPSTVMSRFRP